MSGPWTVRWAADLHSYAKEKYEVIRRMGDLEEFQQRTPKELLAALGQDVKEAEGSLVSDPSASTAPDAAAAGSPPPVPKTQNRTDIECNMRVVMERLPTGQTKMSIYRMWKNARAKAKENIKRQTRLLSENTFGTLGCRWTDHVSTEPGGLGDQ